MKEKKRLEIKRFDNENNSEEICFDKFYNYKPSTVLKNSHGVQEVNFPYNKTDNTTYKLSLPNGATKFEGLALFRQYFKTTLRDGYRLLVYGDDKKIYLNQLLRDSSSLTWLYEMKFDNTPITLSYKKDDEDAIIITDGNQMKIWVTNYSPYTVENVPIITDMCMNEGVLYCCLKYPAFKIWYATDLNPENVGEINKYSGYITLNDNLGNANRIVNLDENIYIIRDYGISKISYVQKNFTVSEIYSSNTKIYDKTVCVCGSLLLFMTNEGLFTFNGVKVTKTEINFSSILENTGDLTASSLANKYYLACKLNFFDDNKVLCEDEDCVNNALIILDIIDYSYEIIRGVDIKQLLAVKTDGFEKMLVLFNTGNVGTIGEIVKNSVYYDENLPKFWVSKQIFDSFETKMFTKLVIDADEQIKVKLIYDDKEITFTTYKTGLNEFMFKISGKQLKLEISSTEATANVNKIYLDYYDY